MTLNLERNSIFILFYKEKKNSMSQREFNFYFIKKEKKNSMSLGWEMNSIFIY